MPPDSGLRQRNLRVQLPPEGPPGGRLRGQAKRIVDFQKRWKTIKEDLPPQLTRRHIGMISIGGVIGTGLFLGSSDALRNGGPVGAFLAYSIMGSVVYCLCVSVGEMISFLPNVGGVVGLTDLYVDPALGFSMGWAAWYNWSVTLPAEIIAAALVTRFWVSEAHLSLSVLSGSFLAVVVIINCFPSRIYGEMEFWFSLTKVTTIIVLIITSFSLLGRHGSSTCFEPCQLPCPPQQANYTCATPTHPFQTWREMPFANDYMGIPGVTGKFLGFAAVLMQAGFSFFGSEVPGIAAGEVIDATRNVPRALRRVWRRILLFYVGGIFAVGLVVRANDTGLLNGDGTGKSSPFVIALRNAKVKGLPDIVNAAILLSAWSAGASDIYISSRFLYFLARSQHAPAFLQFLTVTKPSREPTDTSTPPSDQTSIAEISGLHPTGDGNPEDGDLSGTSAQAWQVATPVLDSAAPAGGSTARHDGLEDNNETIELNPLPSTHAAAPAESQQRARSGSAWILPLFSVLVSSSVGCLVFLNAGKDNNGAAKAFEWLANVTSVASLLSWAGILFTYIRWYKGTEYAENRPDKIESELEGIKRIKKHRHAGQPWLAWYAFWMCMMILLANGSVVFLHKRFRIAEFAGVSNPDEIPGAPELVPTFLAAYLPIPVFVLMTVGYKLVHQTKFVPVDKMTFAVGNIPEPEPYPEPRNTWEKVWYMII